MRALSIHFLLENCQLLGNISGAVNSPQILLNSGVGPRDELEAVGVPVVHDLPGVGQNLHNHAAYAVAFTINDTDTTPLNWATAMEYLLFRDGLMSGTGKCTSNLYKNLHYTVYHRYNLYDVFKCIHFTRKCDFDRYVEQSVGIMRF